MFVFIDLPAPFSPLREGASGSDEQQHGQLKIYHH